MRNKDQNKRNNSYATEKPKSKTKTVKRPNKLEENPKENPQVKGKT